MTPQDKEQSVRTLVAWAITLARQAPKRRNRYSRCAYVPWSSVEGIRAEMEKLGIDWKVTP